MNHPPTGRSIYAIAAFSTLLAAGGVVSMVASARQSPPTAAQAKKPAQTPPPTKVKQVPLPGFDKPDATHPAPAGASGTNTPPERQGKVNLIDGDVDTKTGIGTGKNVVYTEGEMKFTGQSAVYNDNTKELVTQGNLVLDDPKHHVTGDKCHVYSSKRRAVMSGNIVITLKPSTPDPNLPNNSDRSKQSQYPVIITCDNADDYYKKNFIILTGHLVFKQMYMKNNGKMVERTVTADHAEYDGKANKLHLFKPVKSYDSDGQKGEFESDVFVGTKEGEETLTSSGKSNYQFILEEVPDDDTAPEDTTPEKKDVPPPAPPKKQP